MCGGCGSTYKRTDLSTRKRWEIGATAKRYLARFLAPWVAGSVSRSHAQRPDLGPLKGEKAARVLVIAYPPGLGDTLAVTPFLSALGAGLPGAEIRVLAAGGASAILGRHPAVSELIRYEDNWISKDEKYGPRRSRAERRGAKFWKVG